MLDGRHVVGMAASGKIVKIHCPVWILAYFGCLFTMDEIIVLSPFADVRFDGGLGE